MVDYQRPQSVGMNSELVIHDRKDSGIMPHTRHSFFLIIMTYFIAAYLFISFSCGFAMLREATLQDWIASQIAGLLWPFLFVSRLIRAIDKFLPG